MRTEQPAISNQHNYCVDDIPDKTNDIDAPAIAMPGEDTTECEEGGGMGNDAKSFAIVVGGGSNGSIQAAQ